MTGNKAYLVEYQDYNGGPVAFGGSKGQITGKGKIITGKLDFEDVYFVKELKQFNLFSVSQMCDKKNKVLFTNSECIVLSPDFKLPDENQVLLRVPRQNNMYSFNLENIVPTGGSDDENPPPPPPQTLTQQAPHTMSTIKLPILKKGGDDIWDHEMEHYLIHTDYPIWEVIQKGNSPPEKDKEKQGHHAYALPVVSHEMSDQKVLRSLPSSWSKLYLDLFLSAQNVAFCFFLKALASGPNTLDHEDLEKLDEFDLERWTLEMELALTRPRLSALIVITHGTLLENADQKEDQKQEEEMHWIGKLREQLGDASIEIQDYDLALKKVEAQLVTQAVKEKEELKTKLENFKSSSKGLSKLLNSQMSTRDNLGLGMEIKSSDVKDSLVHDRFANVEGTHAVPPPMTGDYMPSGPDREVDDSMFAYGPKQSKTSESDTQTSNYDSCESNSSTETLESISEQVIVKPKVVSQPKVLNDEPIIEEWHSDCDDEEIVVEPKEIKRTVKPGFKKVEPINARKETVRPWNNYMTNKHGLGFTKKVCFVCTSPNHLIKDCNFHENRMARKLVLNNEGKGSGQRVVRPSVRSENQANNTAGPEEVNNSTGTKDNIDAGNSKMKADPAQDYFVLPIYSSYTSIVKSSEAKNEGEKSNNDTGLKTNEEPEFAQEAEDLLIQEGAARATSTNTVNIVSIPISTASPSNVFSTGGPALNKTNPR
ncbi:hypothetical protein Tco_0201358 [Tanacetum coccineum]